MFYIKSILGFVTKKYIIFEFGYYTFVWLLYFLLQIVKQMNDKYINKLLH